MSPNKWKFMANITYTDSNTPIISDLVLAIIIETIASLTIQ